MSDSSRDSCSDQVTSSRNDFPPIEQETEWRRIVYLSHDDRPPGVGHWNPSHQGPHDLCAQPLPDHYTVDVLLNATRIDCFKDRDLIRSGSVRSGSTQVTAPGEKIRCCFERASEAVHLFATQSLVVAAYEDIRQSRCPRGFRLRDPAFSVDPLLGRLALSLTDVGRLKCPFAVAYSENLAMAVLARLMEMQCRDEPERRRQGGLVRWRLNRAIAYMEASLGESVTLQDVADHVGLSRMHFAAQFKNATGSSPHQFLLSLRISKAKELLRTDQFPLARIAVEVGFRSQAHFSVVFRKLTGVPPGCWRAKKRIDLA
jgi:AraC family transcriptional regulator